MDVQVAKRALRLLPIDELSAEIRAFASRNYGGLAPASVEIFEVVDEEGTPRLSLTFRHEAAVSVDDRLALFEADVRLRDRLFDVGEARYVTISHRAADRQAAF